jgi:hypothetical protein
MPRGSAAAWLTPKQKKILAIMLNGDAKTGLLMHIIRFVMPSKSKPLKKLMYFFFEVCPKHDAQGKLRQEWILVWCVDNCKLQPTDMLTAEATPFGSTCRHPTNTCEETHCALCRLPLPQTPYHADDIDSTKLRDAELVEPLLRMSLLFDPLRTR